MDDQIAERIALALEQIALELATPRIFEGIRPIEPEAVTAPAVVNAPTFAPIGQGQPAPVPQCPMHHREMREGKYGWYCPTKEEDGTWCRYRGPSVQSVRALP